jgi:AcrR family transcriptional regulator
MSEDGSVASKASVQRSSSSKPVQPKPAASKAATSARGRPQGKSIALRRPPGRARSDASRRAILDATLKLLESTPLQQISIESIAREAGVGKATIYRWWSSKAAVVIEAFIQEHIGHTPMPKGVSPSNALMRHMHLLVQQYAGLSGHIVGQLLAEGQGDADVLRELRERFWYGRRAVVREVLEQGRRTGEFRSDIDVELQMDILYAPIYFRLIMQHLPLDKHFADAHCEAMLRLMKPEREFAAQAAKRRRTA